MEIEIIFKNGKSYSVENPDMRTIELLIQSEDSDVKLIRNI